MTSENIPLLTESQRLHSKAPDKGLRKVIVSQVSLNDKIKEEEEDSKSFITNYDDILPYIGGIGSWQITMIILLGVMAADGGILVLLQNFTALQPKAFRCALAECDGPNATYRDLQVYPISCSNSANFSGYGDRVCSRDLEKIDNVTTADNTINIHDKNYMCYKPIILQSHPNLTTSNCSHLNTNDIKRYEVCNITDPHQQILYEPYAYKSTIVTEFSLVCDQQYKIALSGTFYMVGLLIGSFIGGPPADRFGRKPVLFFFLICGGLTNISGGLVRSYWPYAVLRGIAGMCEQGLTQVSLTLSMELVGVKYQGVAGGINQGSFAVGTCLVGLIAYFIRDWRLLHFVTSLIIIPQIFVYWFLIPESPRWLSSKRKWKLLKRVLERGFKMNRTRLPTHVHIPDENEAHTSFPSVDSAGPKMFTGDAPSKDKNDAATSNQMRWGIMFSNKTILPRTCIMLFNWGFVALVYYGAGMSSTLLGGDIFVNFELVAVVEVAANIAILFFINHWGRKATLMFGFLLSGVGCSILGFLPSIEGPAALIMLLMGKFGASFAFTACYVFTNELFPTPIRNSAVGTCSMFSRLFSMTAPYISQYLPAVTNEQAPFLIFGVCGLAGCVISAFLPESLGHPLPDTIRDAEEMNKKSKSLFSWWSSKELKKNIERRQHERTQNNVAT